ncbi:hypothetical protein GUJ93_ZPchr0010g11035 [Zizania palustris]|uniref:Uncharacterized protein n=1 Tax=Zizania palustris TaxID=103762 RepID=A0A8J6BIC9_ZIZPA|nr:hypothetical protein GUJ93_ZPchr0010g11035 [Zizania palustris]
MNDQGAGDPGRHHLSPQAGGGGGQPPVPRSPTPLELSSAAAYRRLSPSLRPPAHPQVRLPSPYGQISSSPASGHHARSLSQPLFFSLDSPRLCPEPAPAASSAGEARGSHGGGGCRLDGDDAALYDLVNSYMDLDGMDPLNSSEERHEDRDSRASGTRAGSAAESSENEAESNSTSAERKDGSKSRHCRSLSVDSFMGSSTLPQFTEAEKKKIMANERLAEIALTDPKRDFGKPAVCGKVKGAQDEDIQELEHKVQVLQTEATTLSAQLTMLQRDSTGLATQNNELKIRLQAMEQQARLRDVASAGLGVAAACWGLGSLSLAEAWGRRQPPHPPPPSLPEQIHYIG